MEPVNPNVSFSRLEQEILKFWKEADVFQRSMKPDALRMGEAGSNSAPRASYVFYDGPPFATGLPHYGHLLAGTIKDVVGRFFTMKGFHVDRRFGWDCHGVPVEFEIQKSLDLHGAKDIRRFGVDRFNEECRKIVLRYSKEWERFVDRSGRWVDFDRQYRTMDLDYMESIWWAVKSLWDRGLIYEGFKCVAYSTGMNTPLSNFEANLNYKDVQDPAVTVRAELRGSDLDKRLGLKEAVQLPHAMYIWTTTPWTLPSNMAVAVGEEVVYAAIVVPGKEVAILAKERIAEYFPDLAVAEGAEQTTPVNGGVAGSYIAGEFPGSALVGLEYTPFFNYFESERVHNAFRIYGGSFVTATDGTGIVHLASFGEDDLGVFRANGIPVIDPVDEDGRFDATVPDFTGLYIKEADSKIIALLKERRILVQHRTLEHSYPFCWRTDTPLIYKSIASWFVRVEQIQDLLIHANSQINWVPAHLKEGRFGKWLEGARDWAISRNRFWGTPIPVWRCSNASCAAMRCIGSVAELEAESGAKITDLHSHFVDSLEIQCTACNAKMKRIPEVLDCWFESGAMPYAQAHYPFENKQLFEDTFPADFIAEGLDQTRGWFYTLLVLSTALFGRPAFRNVVVNGIVLAEDGRKMSKSLQNYPPPDNIMDEHGADALRLYLLSSAATRAEELRFSEEGVKHVVRQTLLPLWNAYNFLVTYALVDKWAPEHNPEEPSSNVLDRWILSKTLSLVEGVDTALGSYHLYTAAQPILDFVHQLTNWYIRLNRRRFWVGSRPEEQADKLHAYATLHRVLLTFVRVLAPLAPFISEEIYRNLRPHGEGADSVHLMPFPSREELSGFEIDHDLEMIMELFEEVILLARGLRNEFGLKVRQPLQTLTVVYPDANQLEKLKVVDTYIRDELNVKEVQYVAEEEEFVSLTAKLNTQRLGKVLGPKLGRDRMRELQDRVRSLTNEEIRGIERGEKLTFHDIELGTEDFLVVRMPKAGVKGAASSGQITIVLDTSLSQELRLEGLAREFINRVQKLRKDFGFDVADRIVVKYMTACPRLLTALSEHKLSVMQEILAIEMEEVTKEVEIGVQGSSVHLPSPQEIDGKTVIISLTRTQA